MRAEVANLLQSNKELRQFVRENPNWYKKLSRNPYELDRLEIASLHYYKKTIPDRVEKFSNGVQMASMMMSMFQAMNNQS